MKLMTKINISCAPWTPINKNLLQIYNLPILVKHILVFFFSTNLKNISLKKLEMKIIQRGEKHITGGPLWALS